MKSYWLDDRNRQDVDTRTPPRVRALLEKLEEPRTALLNHPIYRSIHSEAGLHTFMAYHVFAVWDFMSLLKSLQQKMSCVSVPWVPEGDPNLRRLINEIVLGEETDEDGQGGFSSHFELYLSAMRECGANTAVIDATVAHIRSGLAPASAMIRAKASQGTKRFCETTFEVIQRGSVAEVATAFALSREDVIPNMFQRLVDDLRLKDMDGYDRFLYYLDRHISVDGDAHGPMAYEMINALCGENDKKWALAEAAARRTIQSRIVLWDHAFVAIQEVEANAQAAA